MRKILLTMHTGYAGMSSHEAWLIPEGVFDNELDDWAWERAVDYADSYGIYPPSDSSENEDDEPEYPGDNIDGSWRLFEGKDAGKVMYGSKHEISWNEWQSQPTDFKNQAEVQLV